MNKPNDGAVLSFLRQVKFWLFRVRVAVSRSLRLDEGKAGIGLDRLIISPGGVATTFLIDYVQRFAPTNDRNDADWLKHLPYLPKQLRGARIVFVTGSPDEIYCSLFRRNYHTIQGAKLGCLLCQFTWGTFQRALLISAIKRQIKRFRNLTTSPILIVDYDEIWDRKLEIARHLEVDIQSFCRDFPSRRERNSKLDPVVSGNGSRS